MAPDHDKKGTHEPLLNGDEPGDTTLEVDDLVTHGEGGFQEARDGDRIPPERCVKAEWKSEKDELSFSITPTAKLCEVAESA